MAIDNSNKWVDYHCPIPSIAVRLGKAKSSKCFCLIASRENNDIYFDLTIVKCQMGAH